MGKLGLNSGYIGSDQRTTTNGVVGYDKFYLERLNGRFVPVLEGDPDAEAFFQRVVTAGGTLSETEKLAISQLVIQMKEDGIWTKMKAIYPMVGASAAACAQNLKSSSFTGTFNGGWIFASTGVKPNGSNAFMRTGCFANEFLANNQHFSNYSRQLTNTNAVELGLISYDSTKLNYIMFQHNTSNRYAAIQGGDTSMTSNNDPGYGLTISNRRNSSFVQRYLRNVKLESSSSGNGVGTQEVFMSAISGTSLFSTCEIAFGSMGDGLTDTDATNLTNIVNTFQTTLSRQV